MWWYANSGNGEVLYNDRLAIRERIQDLEPFVHVFDNWMRAAAKPLPTTSGKTNPAITLAQAQAVKNQLVQGLYLQKTNLGFTDNTASVNAAIDSVVSQLNASQSQFQEQNANGIALLNNDLATQTGYHNSNKGVADDHAASINGLVSAGGAGGGHFVTGFQGLPTPTNPAVPTFQGVSSPGVSAGGPSDSMASMRDMHQGNINAQTTVEGVASYDITSGW